MLGLSGRQECLELNGALTHWLEPANFFALRPDGDLIAVSSKTLELLRPSIRRGWGFHDHGLGGAPRRSSHQPNITTSFRREEQRFLASVAENAFSALASACASLIVSPRD
jgi:hypothetical protein